jgi:hypothetical protein
MIERGGVSSQVFSDCRGDRDEQECSHHFLSDGDVRRTAPALPPDAPSAACEDTLSLSLSLSLSLCLSLSDCMGKHNIV